MTILQALDSYYGRLDERGDVSAPGWSLEKFGWCIILDKSGEPVDRQDLHDTQGKKPRVQPYSVPAAVKRTVGIAPNFLWDKSAYVLGRTSGTGRRTSQEHAAFVTLHLERLAGQTDEGLATLRRFLEKWTPERFDAPPFMPEMLDTNILFRLEGDKDESGRPRYIHQRPAARALVTAQAAIETGGEEDVLCLITGKRGAAARLHPTIKGVEGAQSSGASLVSFNLDAFTSLGKEQGENAPTSQAAAFRYGAALNHLLTRDGPNRIRRPVGDATVVFWADASDAKAAETADDWFASAVGGDITDAEEAAKVREELEAVANGRPLSELRGDIEPGTRFHVLGLSPNAARLSVRYWASDSLDIFAQRLAQHHQDLKIEPVPLGWGEAPSVNRLLANSTALQRDYKNIPPLLAGEAMRAILSGERYPQSLLAAVVIRLRAGDNAASGWHAAVIRAVLVRSQRFSRHSDAPETGETPMSLKRDHDNPGYQLGRLFAVYELAQRSALGRVNATIRDKYFGAASATPANVFPLIVRGGQSHLSKLRKEKPGWAHLIEKELEEIHGRIEPHQPRSLPRSLSLQNQGEFAIGYYHQRAAKLGDDKGERIGFDDVVTEPAEQGDEE